MTNPRGQRPDAASPRAAASARTNEAAAAAPPIVFVIDDDESMRRALERLLRSVGLQVETFSAASDFIGRALPDRPACVILDLRLPGLSGLEVQESLARAGREVPIIFISGYADVPSSVRALKAGAFDFLQKPFSDQQLLDVIHEALERDRDERRLRAERAAVRERFDTLTPRERDVFGLIVTGLLNKQVGARLGTTEKTVKVHRSRVMQKMGAHSLAELVRMADKISLRL